MFTTRFCTCIILAIGASVEDRMKRDIATPALAARAPQFSANIPNNIPVSGTFPNGITVTPQTPSGSIVTGNNNSTLFGFLPFKRDGDVEARQFNFTLPNRLPVEGTLPFGLNVAQDAQNSTVGLPAGFPFKRDGAAPRALAARDGDRDYNYNQPAYGCDNEDGYGLGWEAEYDEHCKHIPHRKEDEKEEEADAEADAPSEKREVYGEQYGYDYKPDSDGAYRRFRLD